MGNKKTSRPASKMSSAASPATSGQTYTGNKASILRAAFSPSEYQLSLFASVIQGLDAQHIRIHDTITGRLQCEHALSPKETVTSLDWGYYAGRQKDRDQQAKKKRKRNSGVNGAAVEGLDQADLVVAFGTSTSEIRMYSPAEDKIVATFSGVHEKGIRDFKFTANRGGEEGWSIGGDNKLVQWDLCTGQTIKTINLPATSSFTTLSRPVPSNPPVICASSKPYIIDIENADNSSTSPFPAMNTSIHTILSSSKESVAEGAFLTSDNGRYITVLDPQSKKTSPLVMNLVAENEVSSLSLYNGSGNASEASVETQTLAALTEDGTVELFTKPFFHAKDPQAKGNKAKRQNTRRADASVQIVRSEESSSLVPVVMASFQGQDLVIAWAEGGVVPVFERVKWLKEGSDELLFTGPQRIVRTKTASTLSSATTNGSTKAIESRVDESKAVVESGVFMDDDVDMQDDGEDAVSVSGSEVDSDDEAAVVAAKKSGAKETDSDVEMDNASGSEKEKDAEDDEEDEEDETGEPTFGELLRAHDAEEIDVEAELEDGLRMGPLVPGKPNTAVYQIPAGVSLATVLTQSLKTNDNEMLESCFHTNDLSIIRTTIQRLDSSLAATLLQKLAERLAARPGRYGHLLVWVQWACVAHGGALAGRPELLNRMSSLFKIMDQRSSSLSSLLLLKGKLDMLDAQLGLRQSLRSGAEGMESDDEDNVIYVEGQDEDEDENSDAEPKQITGGGATSRSRYEEEDSMMNGIHSGIDDSEDEEEDGSEDEEGEDDILLDVEAEESAGSSDAEESLEENDDDDDDDDEESVGSMVDFIADSEDEDISDDDDVSAPQPPPSKKARLQGGKSKKAGKR
ncbi:hypothetical protein ASPZODRAFT_135497 [Penicilliopsis zonata CBS 506.65]|uniref:Small-subunit processome Utp12 domain-containing protein n=1 Tax=Penicilliopsis zonata CBS 506.65 TaxID=1073090 RepID=A0A1L9SA44_9EURO|nr:hypothetical protein ASPZODRAFT_135497 [Penicilliopsis zonata CBS 506.65]OJJ44052.1 hypothetical protein ASPZODRAFT_135497 [Penicilliopsis zonata CBS 506.65]